MAIWTPIEVVHLITATRDSSASYFTSATDYSGFFKTIEFKEPERNTGEVKFIGATSGKANSEVFEEDPSTAELTGELVLTPVNGGKSDPTVIFYPAATSGSFSYASDPANPSIFIKFSDGESASNYVGFIMQDVTLNTLGGAKVDADGHVSSNIKVTSAANKTMKVYGGTLIPTA
jgi:hypothetical protein